MQGYKELFILKLAYFTLLNIPHTEKHFEILHIAETAPNVRMPSQHFYHNEQK